jgi:hypothetical protein
MGVGGQHHAPVALPPGMTRYPLYFVYGPCTKILRSTPIFVKTLQNKTLDVMYEFSFLLSSRDDFCN